MPTISITIPRKRTADAMSKAQARALFDDLLDRVWGALQAAKAQMSKTADEMAGHAFHGNQYVKGMSGPKTEVIENLKEKTAKGKLRELLESGHSWTDEELMLIAGIDKEATFKAFIYYMRTPKFAGKKGALDVVKDKKSGLWSVKTSEGEPIAASTLAAINSIAAPTPKPIPAPAVAKEEPADFGAEIMAMSGAQPGSMPKGDADKHYAKAMEISGQELKADLLALKAQGHSHDSIGSGKLFKKYKKDKAAAMAAWSQAVHGAAMTPKAPPDDFYAADKEMSKELLAGVPLDKAVANWKKNTANEKAGIWPAKAQAPAQPSAIPGVAVLGSAAPVAPIDYHQLRPEGFKDISPEDITDGKFSTGIAKARTKLLNLGDDAEGNKSKVEKALRARLKDKPNFQALVKRLGLAKEGWGSIESRLIGAWASSSGNGNPISVSLQLAARDAFGIPDSHVEKKALSSLNSLSHEDAVYSTGIAQLNPNMTPLKKEELPLCKEALKEFVQAQYHETQDLLKGLGLNEVYLARGMVFDAKHDAKEGAAKLRLQPASSFSTNITTAKSFASMGGTVFISKVPREQILSTYHSGFGCTSEHEVVVLAHDKMKAYGVPSSQAYSAAGAELHIANKIKGKA